MGNAPLPIRVRSTLAPARTGELEDPTLVFEGKDAWALGMSWILPERSLDDIGSQDQFAELSSLAPKIRRFLVCPSRE